MSRVSHCLLRVLLFLLHESFLPQSLISLESESPCAVPTLSALLRRIVIWYGKVTSVSNHHFRKTYRGVRCGGKVPPFSATFVRDEESPVSI
jgi:hypothetical protein